MKSTTTTADATTAQAVPRPRLTPVRIDTRSCTCASCRKAGAK